MTLAFFSVRISPSPGFGLSLVKTVSIRDSPSGVRSPPLPSFNTVTLWPTVCSRVWRRRGYPGFGRAGSSPTPAVMLSPKAM